MVLEARKSRGWSAGLAIAWGTVAHYYYSVNIFLSIVRMVRTYCGDRPAEETGSKKPRLGEGRCGLRFSVICATKTGLGGALLLDY